MSRPSLSHLPLVVLGALLTLALSGCLLPQGGGTTGLGRQYPMGQGSSPCATAAPTAGTTVRVVLMDMGRATRSGPGMAGRMAGTGQMMRRRMGHGRMMLVALPRVVAAGQVTFVAVNRGSRTHELVVLPLGRHQAIGHRTVGSDRAVVEIAALGEASRSCGPGTGDGLSPGATGWTTLALTPGRYELVCNRPGHYAHGMYAELVVVR